MNSLFKSDELAKAASGEAVSLQEMARGHSPETRTYWHYTKLSILLDECAKKISELDGKVRDNVKKPIRNQHPLCLDSLIDFVDASKPVVWIEVTPKTLRRLQALKDDNKRYLVEVDNVLPATQTLLGYKIVTDYQADGVEMHIRTSKHDAPCIKRLLI